MKNNLVNFFSSKLKSANQIKLAFPEEDDRIKEAKSVLSSIGLELVNILDKHPNVILSFLGSQNHAGDYINKFDERLKKKSFPKRA